MNPKHSGALKGFSRVIATVSKHQTARQLRRQACTLEPDDSECIVFMADEKGPGHIAALERVLTIYDPDSREARGTRVHLATDKAVGERELRRLTSPYQSYEIPLARQLYSPSRVRGVTVKLTINGKKFNLLLDTGANGISISAKAAKKAALEGLSDETREFRGVGDGKNRGANVMLASEVQIGDLTFADVPVEAYNGVDLMNDGLIGADFFAKFMLTIDFYKSKLTLAPYVKMPAGDYPDAPEETPAGFVRAFRSGNHLNLITAINDKGQYWFLIDSGSSENLVDNETARTVTMTLRDSNTQLRGVQGSVNNIFRAQRLKLTFAGYRQENQSLIAFDLTKVGNGLGTQISGIFGMSMLERMALTINYVEGTVRLEYHK